MERASSRNQLSLLPRIGGRFGEWFEALSYGKRGLGKMRRLQAKPATGFGGIPPQGKALKNGTGEYPEKEISGEAPEKGVQGKPRKRGCRALP